MFEAILRELEARIRKDSDSAEVVGAEASCHRAGDWVWIHAAAVGASGTGDALERANDWIGLAPEPPTTAHMADLDAWATAVFPFRRRVPADQGVSRPEGVRVVTVGDSGLVTVAVSVEADVWSCGHGSDVVERTLAVADAPEAADLDAAERFVDVLVEQDRWTQAAPRLERLVEHSRGEDADPTDLVWRLAKLAAVRARLGDTAGTDRAAREAADVAASIWSPEHTNVALVDETVADALEAASRGLEAVPWLEDAVRIYDVAGRGGEVTRLTARLERARAGAGSTVESPTR